MPAEPEATCWQRAFALLPYPMLLNGNWRLTFRFVGTDAEVVDYQDYH
jgi:hypothetical protein